MDDLRQPMQGDKIYAPEMSPEKAVKLYKRWQTAVEAARQFPAED